jgi:hypothetical protein
MLERKLNACFPGARIEVINCGTSGMATGRHLMRLVDYLDLEPDLMLLYEGVNDVRYDVLTVWVARHPLVRLPLLSSRFLSRYLAGCTYPSDRIADEILNDVTISNLDAVRRAAARRGIRVALCSIACPDVDHLPRAEREFYEWDSRTHWSTLMRSASEYAHVVSQLNAQLLEFCRQHDTLYIPVAENLSGGIRRFWDVCHLRRNGIERKADIICVYIKEYIRPAVERMQQ